MHRLELVGSRGDASRAGAFFRGARSEPRGVAEPRAEASTSAVPGYATALALAAIAAGVGAELDPVQVVGGIGLLALGIGIAGAARTMLAAQRRAEARADGLERELREQRGVKQASREHDPLTQNIIDRAGTPLCMTDALGRCTYFNPAAQAALGYTADQLQGRVLHSVLAGVEAADATGAAHGAVQRAAVRLRRDAIRRADGSAVPVLRTVNALARDGVHLGSVLELCADAEPCAAAQADAAPPSLAAAITVRSPAMAVRRAVIGAALVAGLLLGGGMRVAAQDSQYPDANPTVGQGAPAVAASGVFGTVLMLSLIHI